MENTRYGVVVIKQYGKLKQEKDLCKRCKVKGDKNVFIQDEKRHKEFYENIMSIMAKK